MKKNTVKKNGYVILYAILLSSILLTISLSVLSITTKQQFFNRGARDSYLSFYASDSGAECGLQNDQQGIFEGIPAHASVTIVCRDQALLSNNYGTDTEPAYQFIGLPVNDAKNCVDVSVEKHVPLLDGLGSPVLDIDGNPIFQTKVESKGYNVSCGDVYNYKTGVSSAVANSIVERSLLYTYDE